MKVSSNNGVETVDNEVLYMYFRTILCTWKSHRQRPPPEQAVEIYDTINEIGGKALLKTSR